MAVLVIPEFAMDLKQYAELIKQREQARLTAERLKLQTKKAWKRYYDIERDISKANEELGLADIMEFNVPPNTPDAPVKKRLTDHIKKRIRLDSETSDAKQLSFDSE